MSIRQELAWLCGLTILALTISWWLPVGYQGLDDYHYFTAAQAWLRPGPYVPLDHWSTRLPYVWLFAVGIELFGVTEAAMKLPSSLLFAVIMLLAWAIGRLVGGPRTAVLALVAIAITPLLLRMPTTYYPESLEIALSGMTLWLVLMVVWTPMRWRLTILLAAGLIGGLTLLVRQTSAATPVALALFLWCYDPLGRVAAVRKTATLAVGYAIPLIVEMVYYHHVTGDPLYRFVVDQRHVLIPSMHLDGEVFTGGHPLFNWVLAARWDVPALIRVHWTVNPLIRIFTSPGLLLLPWLALIGGVVAWRRRGAARPLVVLAGSLFLLQYAVNTFVLVIPPDTRYYAVSYFLAAILAGMALSTLSAWLQLAVVGGLMLAPCLAVMALEPSSAARLAPLLPVMQRYQPLYLPQMAEQGAYLALQTGHFPDVHEGVAPVGTYALLAPEEATACWKVMEAETPTPDPLWRLVETLRLDRVVPPVIARQLRRSGDATVVAQRTC